MCTTPMLRASILVVDDEKIIRESLRKAFKNDHELHTVASGQEAFNHLRQHTVDLVFLDIRLPDMNGIDLLKEIKCIAPATRVIMLTAVQTIETALDAMKNGAFDYLAKPLDIRRVKMLTEQAMAWKTKSIKINVGKHIRGRGGQYAAVGKILKALEPILPYEGHVLIEGPDGTGKQQIARALHHHSARADRPYATIDCAAMSVRDILRKLWGLHRKTLHRAPPNDPGKIDLAHIGSLFLDNISYLALDLQDKLVHLIEHQEFKRPESPTPIKTDVRIIAATTQNIKTLANAGLFNKDLYFHLSALPLSIPLLHAKGEAIGLLLGHFRKQMQMAGRNHKAPRNLTCADAARSTSIPCDWSNSVREFEHLVARFCNLRRCHVPLPTNLPDKPLQDATGIGNGFDLKTATQAFERQHIITVLKAVKGNRSQAARRLGIHRNTLLLKTKELGIDGR